MCLVTDAMAATGMGDGTFELGGQVVDVAGGRATVSGTDTLAGSTLTMATAVENAVAHLGIDVPTAVAMATTIPARLLPGANAGRLHVDGPADLVRLGSAAQLRGVWIGGPGRRGPARGAVRTLMRRALRAVSRRVCGGDLRETAGVVGVESEPAGE